MQHDLSLWRIFYTMVLAGVSAVGGGQGTIASAQASWVGTGLMSPESFAWAVGLGQITPGPISVLVAALGWQIRGPAGGAVALLGVTLPTWFLSCLAARGLERWRASFSPYAKSLPWLVTSLALVAALKMVLPMHPGVPEGVGVLIAAVLAASGKVEPYVLIGAGALLGAASMML